MAGPLKPRPKSHITFSVERMPEVLALMRRELAKLTRRVAKNETPEVAKRLNEIAAAFEAGQGVE